MPRPLPSWRFNPKHFAPQDYARQVLIDVGLTRAQILNMDEKRTLHIKPSLVEEKKGEGWDCDEGQGCLYMALTKIRLALELGCGKILIERGVHHRHSFDTVDMLLRLKRLRGGFSTPKKPLPPGFAILKERAAGSFMDFMPTALSSR